MATAVGVASSGATGGPGSAPRPGTLGRAAPWLDVWAIFRRFWPETRSFRGRLVVSLGLVAAGPLLGAVGIWLFKILIDEVLTAHNFALFPPLAAAYVGITLGEGDSLVVTGQVL